MIIFGLIISFLCFFIVLMPQFIDYVHAQKYHKKERELRSKSDAQWNQLGEIAKKHGVNSQEYMHASIFAHHLNDIHTKALNKSILATRRDWNKIQEIEEREKKECEEVWQKWTDLKEKSHVNQ